MLHRQWKKLSEFKTFKYRNNNNFLIARHFFFLNEGSLEIIASTIPVQMSVSLPDLISEVKNVWSSGCNISSIRVYYLFNDLETSLRHHQPAVLLRGHLQYHPCHTGIIQLFYSINNRVGDLRRSRWSTARCRAWRLDRVYLQCVLIISTQFSTSKQILKR